MKPMISENEVLSKFLDGPRGCGINSSDLDVERLENVTGGANWRARLLSEAPREVRRAYVYLYARLRRDFELLTVD